MSDETKKESVVSESDLEKVTRERDEYLEGWKRAKADYLNYKKDEAERFASWGKMANESLVGDLLLVLDSLHVGLSMISEGSAEKKGMVLIEAQLEDVLRRYGLEKLKAPPGESFDPSRMEAVGEIESEHPPGSVAEETENGYMLGGRVIRPIKVKISKAKN